VILCPVCNSGRTLIRVDRRRLARCLECGAGWVQEGAWQHSVTRPSGPGRTLPEALPVPGVVRPPAVHVVDQAAARTP
jgi:hypothetical protein